MINAKTLYVKSKDILIETSCPCDIDPNADELNCDGSLAYARCKKCWEQCGIKVVEVSDGEED